jgi:hypothetical protein
MTPHVLPIHLPRRPKEVIPVAETDKPIPLTLGRSLIPNNACLLDGRPF